MRALFNLLVFTLCVTFSFSQNWKKESFLNFTKEYQRLLSKLPQENYEVDIDFNYFMDAKEIKPVETDHAHLQVYTDLTYVYRSTKTAQIQLNSFRIDIDSSQKEVYISKPHKQNNFFLSNEELSKLDSTAYEIQKKKVGDLLYFKLIELKQMSQIQTTIFCFDLKKVSFNSLEMTYWPMNYEMNSLEDESYESPKVYMKYSKLQVISPERNRAEIESKKWVQSSDQSATKFHLVEDKKEYKLTDLR